MLNPRQLVVYRPLLKKLYSPLMCKAVIKSVPTRSCSFIFGRFHGIDNRYLSDTSAFVQDGVHIQELPCIVRIIHGEFAMHDGGKSSQGAKMQGLRLESLPSYVDYKLQAALSVGNMIEEKEMILGFSRCTSLSELYILLDNCPQSEVTPNVALAIIRNLIQLENNKKFRNPSSTYLPEEDEEENTSLFTHYEEEAPRTITFTRAAIMERLVSTICTGKDPQAVLDAVKALRKDTAEHEKPYLKRLCDECMVLVTMDKLSVSQISALAQDLYLIGDEVSKSYAEKLWVGIETNLDKLTVEDTCDLFAMLPYVTKTRSFVFNLAERKSVNIWYKFKVENIIEIVSILVTCNCNSHRLFSAISRWTNVNIHALSEGNMRWIVLAFTKLKFTDSNFQTAMERYAKARKDRLSDPSLVSAMMKYCSVMRFRSPKIFEVCSQFFVKHHEILSVPDIYDITQPFGYLNYKPKNCNEFFHILETLLERNYVAFSPDLFVELLLGCIYIQKYPLNLTHRIFSPYFFNRMNYLKQRETKDTLMMLRVLDKALMVESPCYNGPNILRKSSQGTYWLHRDARISCTLDQISNILSDIAGDSQRVILSVPLKGFPSADLYKIDAVIEKVTQDSDTSEVSHLYALLIHPPEHYNITQTNLIGSQAMKVRHLKREGYRVVHLNLDALNSYYKNPKKVKSYIIRQIEASEL